MSVLLETSRGDIVIDLLVDEAPRCCENFIKLCKIKYYNYSPIYNVQANFSFQTGDPLGPDSVESNGGECIWSYVGTSDKKTFEPEFHRDLKHAKKGTVSMATVVSNAWSKEGSEALDTIDEAERVAGSQFIVTLADNIEELNGKAAIFGYVVEGFDTLDRINEAFVDMSGRPLQDIRIRHTHILDDPFPDLVGLQVPSSSPVPSAAQLATVRIADDEVLNDDMDREAMESLRREREARAQALTLEMLGDLPFAQIKPPENVLFVCRLNPVTQAEDLQLIFSRFGGIISCEVIRDARTGDSLQYAFIEFDGQDACERAYFKMQDVLIDDHRIHVDFSQSVANLSCRWMASRQSRMIRRKKEVAEEKKSKGPAFAGIQGLEKRRQYRECYRDKGEDESEKYEYVESYRERDWREERRRERDRDRERSGRERDKRKMNQGRRRTYEKGESELRDRRSRER